VKYVGIGPACRLLPVVLVAVMPAVAVSQDESGIVEEIVVRASAPILGSQRAAIEQKRNADNVMDVIAADMVGQFPDQNSAAALSRVPAVAVQRDQGQERYIQIRGAPNRWTSVSIDGINAIGVDESGGQRAFRFDAVPAVILSALEVNKSLTPDITAEAVVSQVNLRTFSPFDLPGFNVAGDFGVGEMDLGGGDQQQYSTRISWSGEQFGVIAGYSYYKREQITDNREFDYDADEIPIFQDFRSYQLTRETSGGLLGFEYRPAEAHRLFFKTIFSDFDDHEKRDQYVFQMSGARSGTRGAESGDLVGVAYRGTFSDGEYENSNVFHTLGGDHLISEWDVFWRVNYTNTENNTYLPLVLAQQALPTQRLSIRYDRRDIQEPILSLATTVAGAEPGTFVRGEELTALPQGPSAYAVHIALPIDVENESDAWSGKLDLAREMFWFDRPVLLKLGMAYEDRDIEGAVFSTTNILVLNALLPQIGATFNAGNYETSKGWKSGFNRGFDVNYVDNGAMRRDLEDILRQLTAAGLYNPANAVAPSDKYAISEQIWAGYASASWETGNIQWVSGLRVERQDQDIDGFVTAGGVSTPVSESKRELDFFPSLNARIELQEDLLLRLAAQAGISRPSFGTIRTGAAINDIGRTVSGGNPQLDPERTFGFDVSLERYLSGSGLVSLAGFYRYVDDVLYDSASIITDNRFNSPDVDRTGYTFLTTLNGRDGKLYGIELAYLQQFDFLPEVLNGFGFQGNIAYLNGDFETNAGESEPFPGTSDWVVNASLFYEKYDFSIRLSYQWRDDWLDTIGGFGAGESRKEMESVDLSVRYAFNDYLTVFLDANNLTDEVYVAYEGSSRTPTEVEQIGRRWMAGIRFMF